MSNRLYRFADFLEQQVPEERFDMSSYFSWVDPEHLSGFAQDASYVNTMLDVVAPDAPERRYSCMSSACAAGWAVLWAERVLRESVLDDVPEGLSGISIHQAAVDYLTADLTARRGATRVRLGRFFERDVDVWATTPREAAEVIREIAWKATAPQRETV